MKDIALSRFGYMIVTVRATTTKMPAIELVSTGKCFSVSEIAEVQIAAWEANR
jgi:hypothetical protein